MRPDVLDFGFLFDKKFAIDSRLVHPGSVFCAIQGGSVDGRLYIPSAIENGADVVIAAKGFQSLDFDGKSFEEFRSDAVRFIEVDDVVLFLGKLARGKFDLLVDSGARTVAVTGSFGKTTTRQLIMAMLSRFGKTHGPIRNFNNHIGLPLTVLNADRDIKYLVLEMGINRPGEMVNLVDIAPAEVRVVTNVHLMHSEFFDGSLVEIVKEKLSIASNLENLSALILNSDISGVGEFVTLFDQNVLRMGVGVKVRMFSDSTDIKDFRLQCSAGGMGAGIAFKAYGRAFEMSVVKSERWLQCVLASINVLESLGMEADPADVRGFVADEGRGRIVRLKCGISVIDDSYNAGLESVREALWTLENVTKDRVNRVAVLGDMGEVHDSLRRDQYMEIIREAVKICKTVCVVGELMGSVSRDLATLLPEVKVCDGDGGIPAEEGDSYGDGITCVYCLDGKDEVNEFLVSNLCGEFLFSRETMGSGAVLLKASNSVGLFHCVSALIECFGGSCDVE